MAHLCGLWSRDDRDSPEHEHWFMQRRPPSANCAEFDKSQRVVALPMAAGLCICSVTNSAIAHKVGDITIHDRRNVA
jgi:hypothetical protein